MKIVVAVLVIIAATTWADPYINNSEDTVVGSQRNVSQGSDLSRRPKTRSDQELGSNEHSSNSTEISETQYLNNDSGPELSNSNLQNGLQIVKSPKRDLKLGLQSATTVPSSDSNAGRAERFQNLTLIERSVDKNDFKPEIENQHDLITNDKKPDHQSIPQSKTESKPLESSELSDLANSLLLKKSFEDFIKPIRSLRDILNPKNKFEKPSKLKSSNEIETCSSETSSRDSSNEASGSTSFCEAEFSNSPFDDRSNSVTTDNSHESVDKPVSENTTENSLVSSSEANISNSPGDELTKSDRPSEISDNSLRNTMAANSLLDNDGSTSTSKGVTESNVSIPNDSSSSYTQTLNNPLDEMKILVSSEVSDNSDEITDNISTSSELKTNDSHSSSNHNTTDSSILIRIIISPDSSEILTKPKDEATNSGSSKEFKNSDIISKEIIDSIKSEARGFSNDSKDVLEFDILVEIENFGDSSNEMTNSVNSTELNTLDNLLNDSTISQKMNVNSSELKTIHLDVSTELTNKENLADSADVKSEEVKSIGPNHLQGKRRHRLGNPHSGYESNLDENRNKPCSSELSASFSSESSSSSKSSPSSVESLSSESSKWIRIPNEFHNKKRYRKHEGADEYVWFRIPIKFKGNESSKN